MVLGAFGWFCLVLAGFGWFWLVACFITNADIRTLDDFFIRK